MKNIQVTSQEVLAIREENKNLLNARSYQTHADRYRALAKKFSRSEWTIRWVCQGREYLDVGGFIENVANHEASTTRAIDNNDALEIRERYNANLYDAYDLANKYAVSYSTIRRILLGKTYRDVGGPTFTAEDLAKRADKKPLDWGSRTLTARARVNRKTNPIPPKPMNLATLDSHDVSQDSRSLTDEESKLNGMDVFIIRSSYKNGKSINDILINFNLNYNSICDIIEGRIFTSRGGPISKINVVC